jgi:hypothetical protein
VKNSFEHGHKPSGKRYQTFRFALVSFSDEDSKFILQLISSKGIYPASQCTLLSFSLYRALIPFFSPETRHLFATFRLQIN